MARIERLPGNRWVNFHETVWRDGVDHRALVAEPLPDETPAAFLRRTAGAVAGLLVEARETGQTVQVIG
jgi:hypothetical protein